MKTKIRPPIHISSLIPNPSRSLEMDPVFEKKRNEFETTHQMTKRLIATISILILVFIFWITFTKNSYIESNKALDDAKAWMEDHNVEGSLHCEKSLRPYMGDVACYIKTKEGGEITLSCDPVRTGAHCQRDNGNVIIIDHTSQMDTYNRKGF